MTDSTLSVSIQQAVQGWSALDWAATQAAVNHALLEMKTAKDQSLVARKQLAETTKSFKKTVKVVETCSFTLVSSNTPDAVQAVVKAVDVLGKQSRTTVKSYQEEIDSMTRRCKSSEAAYIALGQALLELPDPAAVLQACLQTIESQQAQLTNVLGTVEHVNEELQNVEKANQNYKKEIATLKAASGGGGNTSSGNMSKAEREELIQLRREVGEYEVEFRQLKNQDITIRKLEAKIQELQASSEDQMKEQLEKAKEELIETEGRRTMEALEREAAMERRVQTLELQLRAERAGREATQEHLLEADEGVSQREAAWEAQKKILVDDAERLRETLHATSTERDNLRLKVAAIEGRSGKSAMTPPPSGNAVSIKDLMLERKAYEAEVTELSDAVTLLREEIRQKEESFGDERSGYLSRLDELERDKATLTTNLASLETQLADAPSQSTVDLMRRELRILKRLEYNADDIDNDRDPEMTGEDDGKDLESVLIAKLRRVESELVKERTSRIDLVDEMHQLKEKVKELESARDASEKLIASLEKDLELAISVPRSPSLRKTSAPLQQSSDISEAATLQSVLDPDAPVAPPPTPPPPSLNKTAAEKADDDHSVATIIMAQRDRLRARCDSLEAERDSFKRELQAQVSAAESLKMDNTKLYEKVRYLQSISKTAGGGAYSRPGAALDLDLEALEQRYEASVDPFKQFNKAERQRKMKEMSPMERTVFLVAKTFLATKEMRAFLFVYVVSLHMLVFITTYNWSHTGNECHVDNEHVSHLAPHEMQEHVAAENGSKAG
ncbi:hypothetical protein MPSEU_000301400 [Mayamaea pseudoterrestris]|nr:hypothetical protein MPSEU_000301400 [Mayamaea pseudoterrestris]